MMMMMMEMMMMMMMMIMMMAMMMMLMMMIIIVIIMMDLKAERRQPCSITSNQYRTGVTLFTQPRQTMSTP